MEEITERYLVIKAQSFDTDWEFEQVEQEAGVLTQELIRDASDEELKALAADLAVFCRCTYGQARQTIETESLELSLREMLGLLAFLALFCNYYARKPQGQILADFCEKRANFK